jgi:hypothetical protein
MFFNFKPNVEKLAAKRDVKKKRGRESLFQDLFGRPRGRNVDSIPNRSAIRRIQVSSP